MTWQARKWGMGSALALLGAFACSGKALNDLGDVNSAAGTAATAGATVAAGGTDAAAGRAPSEAGGAPTEAGAGNVGGSDGLAGSNGRNGGAGAAGADDAHPNLIKNGDFSAPDSGWGLSHLGSNEASYAPSEDGALCASVSDTDSFVVLGWPFDVSQAAVLIAGRRYKLSYDVKGSGSQAVLVDAKVGHAVMPFTEDFSDRHEAVIDNVYRKVSYVTILTSGDNQAGVALQLSAIGGSGTTTVCFDNISLSETEPPP